MCRCLINPLLYSYSSLLLYLFINRKIPLIVGGVNWLGRALTSFQTVNPFGDNLSAFSHFVFAAKLSFEAQYQYLPFLFSFFLIKCAPAVRDNLWKLIVSNFLLFSPNNIPISSVAFILYPFIQSRSHFS